MPSRLATIIGTSKRKHLESALEAVETPIDEDFLAQVLSLTAEVHSIDWPSGLPENN